ncbi:MAG: hypothetical protein HQK83_02280 [Fibrobacteria bacterium]|nr:hypothetical protein [Fibrobacteria bacterium]
MNTTAKISVFFLIFLFIANTSAFRRQKEYCSLLAKCGIEIQIKECPDSMRVGIKGIEYTDSRCAEARSLEEVGVLSTDYQGQKLYGFLGQKYRVDYKVESTLPIKTSRFEYLLQDIPLAAKVVNAFQKTKYTVSYLDGERRRYWRGDNGDNLSGEANLIAGNIKEKHLVYFGFGIVKILKWKLKGQVLFDFKYKEENNQIIPYDLKVVVFPGGAIVNAIMNMGLFKRVVKNKILEVFKDITDSADDLSKMPFDKLLLKYKWTEEDVQKLKVLLSL